MAYDLQLTLNNSNLYGKSLTVQVIGSSKQVTRKKGNRQQGLIINNYKYVLI